MKARLPLLFFPASSACSSAACSLIVSPENLVVRWSHFMSFAVLAALGGTALTHSMKLWHLPLSAF
jgi:hypothetical protein